MSLYQKIESDLRDALKQGDTVKVSVLRMVLSSVKLYELEKTTGKIEEADIVQIIQRQIKQHRESIEQFTSGKRQDLVDKEAEELKILETYVPKQLEEAELINIIKETVAETGASAKSDSGKVMKAVMEKVRGKADGKIVNRLVMGLLNPSAGSGFNPEH